MDGQFYLTLPSNSSMGIYPKNTLSDFTVHLPQPLDLAGDWVVALSEIQYPHTWNNIRQLSNVFHIRRGSEPPKRFSISAGYYQTVRQLLKAITKQLDGGTQKDLTLTFDEITRHVKVRIKSNFHLLFGDGLAAVLGFDEDTPISKTTISPRVASLAAGFHSLYVYSDVVDAQVVGDAMVPLLLLF